MLEVPRIPPPRPVLWPLRRVSTADIKFERRADGRRRIVIRHAELKGVSPEMLAWWYRHIVGDMDYAGARWPRYLVWHPLDHISYEIVRPSKAGGVGSAARVRIREAFQRDPDNLLDITVTVERIDEQAAVIAHRVLGLPALRLINRFEATPTGTRYVTDMMIGSAGMIGRRIFNPLIGARILPGRHARAWVRHHIEEIGNLETFLPELFAQNALGLEKAVA